MTRDDILKRIASRKWYHCIEVAPGIVTPGVDNDPRRLDLLQFPDDLTGKSVLDIGAYDGFFSFEAEKRGAARVLALDHNPPDLYGFNTAKEILGSRVEHRVGSVYDLSPKTVGEFDVVLFLGVIYHLRSPLLALERIHSVCREVMYVESHVCAGGVIKDGELITSPEIQALHESVPLAQFIPGSELNDDATNWWIPSRLCLEKWIRSHGFEPTLLAEWPSGIPGGRAAFRCVKAQAKLPRSVLNY